MTEQEAIEHMINDVLAPKAEIAAIEKDLTNEMKDAGFNVKAIKAAASARFREQEEAARETAETLVELLTEE
jgi:uncharacterized protein (UPF0335 family)